MDRERLNKPIAPLQRAPDATLKARVPTQPVRPARLPQTLALNQPTPAQLEIQRVQAFEVQRQAKLEVQRAAIQRAHEDRLSSARASQTSWHALSLKSVPMQRAVSEHARSARAARDTRAAFVAQRSAETLETLVAQRLERQVRPALPTVQRQADLTLSHVADHYGDKAAVQLARDPERLSSYAGFKNAGAGLVKNFRTPGSTHTMPQLAEAIQRFREPMQRAAVQGAAFAAFGAHPTYPQQLQRALEERDSQLNVQREAWQRELEPVAQRLASEEASGENAAGMIEAARGGGQPLPAGVRNLLETKWNTDLSKVRVHTDSSAAAISKKFNAKALTSANNIFFAAGMWNPTSLEGLQLIAHEAWHTVQQAGGLVEKGVDKNRNLELEAQAKGAELSSADVQIASSGANLKAKGVNADIPKRNSASTSSATRAVQRKPKSATKPQPPVRTVKEKADSTYVDVLINGAASADTPRKLMILVLIRLGYDEKLAKAHTNKNGDFEYGDYSRSWVWWRKPTAEEIKNKIMRVGVSSAELKTLPERTNNANQQFRTESSKPTKTPGSNPEQITGGTTLRLRGAAFNKDSVTVRSSTDAKSKIITNIPFGTTFLIIESISGWYKIQLKSGATGFVSANDISVGPDEKATFYKIEAGKDTALKIAGRKYGATNDNLRFYVLVLAKVNPDSIKMPKGIDWKDESSWKRAVAIAGNYMWIPSKPYADSLQGILSNGRSSNIAEVGEAIVKKTITGLGGGKVIKTLEEIVPNVNLIWDNPSAFMTNLHKSFELGFGNFQARFGEHLQAGVMDWLQSALGAKFTIPEKPDAAGLLSVGLQVVGLDYTNNLRPMLASGLSDAKVTQLEAASGVLQAAAKTGSLTPVMQMVQSREKAFKGMLDGLPGMILGSLKDFAVKAIVAAGIKKMLTMLVPGGGLVQAAISIYDAITFIMGRAEQLGNFLKNLTLSFANIARGEITPAATKIEGVLKNGLSLSLGFLASAAGLTKVAGGIRNALEKIRKPANAVLVKIKKWIVLNFQKLVERKGAKPVAPSTAKPIDGRTTAQKEKAVREAVAEATKLMGTTEVSKESAQQKLKGIKARYKVTKLEFIQDSKKPYLFRASAKINPEFEGPPGVLLTYSELKGLSKVAARFAKDIIEKPGFRAKYLKDKYEFLRGGDKVKIGDSVEAAALPAVEEMARKEKLTLVVSPELFLVDSDNNKIGGSQAELDFLMVRDKAVVKVLSVKMSSNNYRASKDRKLLKRFLEIPLSKPDIVTYAKANFGPNDNYSKIDKAIVKSSMGTEDLSSFREKYLSKTNLKEVEVELIAPKSGDDRGYQLRVGDEQLIDVVIKFIDKKLRSMDRKE